MDSRKLHTFQIKIYHKSDKYKKFVTLTGKHKNYYYYIANFPFQTLISTLQSVRQFNNTQHLTLLWKFVVNNRFSLVFLLFTAPTALQLQTGGLSLLRMNSWHWSARDLHCKWQQKLVQREENLKYTKCACVTLRLPLTQICIGFNYK